MVVAGDPDANGEMVLVHDARDGSELVRATIPSNVSAMAFDDEVSQLLVAAADDRLRTIDLDNGVVIADVPIDGPIEGAGSIGVTTDGLVTLISSGADGHARIIDRFSGQTRGPDLELAETSGGRTRPDDTIVTWGSDLELDIIDPRSEPLVEQAVALTIDDAELGDNEQRVIVNGQPCDDTALRGQRACGGLRPERRQRRPRVPAHTRWPALPGSPHSTDG